MGPAGVPLPNGKRIQGCRKALAGYGKLAVAMSAAPRPRRRRTYFFEAPLRRPGLVLAPVVFLTLAAAAVAHLLPPRYRAATLLRAEWDAADEALLRQRGVDLESRRTQAVRQRATDRVLLERVLREASPYAAAGHAKGPLDPQVERLLSDLRVRSMASSSFVIEFVHRDPATAARVPNLLARELAAGEGHEAPADQPTRLETRLAEARRALKQKADALGRQAPAAPRAQAKADESDAVPPDEEAFAEKRAVAASLATARSRAERLRLATLAEARSTAPPTPRQELERLRAELAELRKRYTEEHPDVEKLRRQIMRLEASLPPAASRPPSPQEELRATEVEIEELVARQAQLDARTATAVRAQPRPTPPPAAGDPARQQAVLEHERAQQAYQALLEESQAAEAEARSRASHGPITRFEVLRDAAIPRAPESPDPVLFVLTGALAGLVTGLLAAFVAEHRDRSVKGPEDLENILPVPLLATLPEVRARDRR